MDKFCIKCGNHFREFENRVDKRTPIEYFRCREGGEHVYAIEFLESEV